MEQLMKRLVDVLIAGMLLVAVAVGSLRAYQYYDVRANDPTKIKKIADWQRYSEGGVRLGPKSAPVVIVEFADFQCPFCRRADSTLKRVLRQYPNEVAVVYRHYPVHEYAFVAAQAVECAARQGDFVPMHDALYADADSIGAVSWGHFAVKAGVRDTAEFTRCLADPQIAARVVADTTAAHRLRVHGTPTFLINNLRIVGYAGSAAFDSVLALALPRPVEYGSR